MFRKKAVWLLTGLLVICTLTVSLTLANSPPVLERWIVASGGDQYLAGNLTMGGTLGQWVSGLDQNGTTSLNAGFWQTGQPPCYKLVLIKEPVGGGDIQADPSPNCGDQYTVETVVELTAIPYSGYMFDHWSGSLTGTSNPKSIVIQNDVTVTAHFDPIEYKVYLPLIMKK